MALLLNDGKGFAVKSGELFGGLRTHLDLFLTYRCNYRCSHCFLGDSLGKLTFETVEAHRILAEAARLGAQTVAMLGGEPTLLPELGRIVDEAWRLGYEDVRVVTNGGTSAARFLRTNFSNRTSIVFSVDGTKAVHDQIRGLGAFDQLVSSIQLARLRGLPIVGIPSFSAKNIHIVEQVLEFFQEQDFEAVNIHTVSAVGYGVAEGRLEPADWDRREQAASRFTDKGSMPVRLDGRPDGVFVGCAVRGEVQGNTMVFPDGSVRLCGLLIDSVEPEYAWTGYHFERLARPGEVAFCVSAATSNCPAQGGQCVYTKTIK